MNLQHKKLFYTHLETCKTLICSNIYHEIMETATCSNDSMETTVC